MKLSTSSAALPPPPRQPLAPLKPPSEHFSYYTRDSDSKSDRGPVDLLPGYSTPFHQSTSITMPAAYKSSRTKEFDTVHETLKLYYEQWPKWDCKPITRYSEHGFVRLVAEPNPIKRLWHLWIQAQGNMQ